MADVVRVLLAEDHALVREGTRALLEVDTGITVVGEAADGEQAVQMASRLRPDVVIVDIGLPRLNGIEAIRRIRTALPEARLLALTVHDEEQYVMAAIRAGADGYFLKDIPGRQLLAGVRSLLAGESLLDATIVPKVFARIADGSWDAAPPGGHPLTTRELEVLRIASSGCSSREIARRLDVSSRTVQTHLSHIFQKLDVESRTEAVVLALKRGWFSLEETAAPEGDGE